MKKLSLLILTLGLAGAFLFPKVTSAATQYQPEDLRGITVNQPLTLYGKLLGVGNTSAPGSFVIRVNDTTDYIIYFDSSTVFLGVDGTKIGLDWYLPGDGVKVIGRLNADGLSVDASSVTNMSVRAVSTHNINGYIKSIDAENNQATLSWSGRNYRLDFITGQSKIIVGSNFNADVSDLRVGDRVRGRGLKHATLDIVQVRILMVLKRGTREWVRNNTEILRGTLLSIETEEIPSSAPEGTEAIIRVKDHIRNKVFTVYTKENTIFLRRYWGRSALDELMAGDYLAIVGRRSSNDSLFYTARAVRDYSLVLVNTKGVPGTITEINLAAGNFILERLGVSWRIDVNDITRIMLITPDAIISPATLEDLQVGDTCRGRGIRHATLNIIEARQGVCWRE